MAADSGVQYRTDTLTFILPTGNIGFRNFAHKSFIHQIYSLLGTLWPVLWHFY